jgi:hypothetical protein
MKLLKTSLLRSFLTLVMIFAAAAGARADYRSTILGDSPAGYWRLDETHLNQTCTNYGSAGAPLNAYYNLGKFVPTPGAIAGDTDGCAAFDGVMDRVEVPYTPTLNPSGSFSVEFWALRTIASSAASTYYSPIWARGNGTANGFLFYVDPNNKWTFWIGATNASMTKWVNPLATNTMAGNKWYHLVGTYGPVVNGDVTNWFATLYVNGVMHSSLQVDTSGFAFQPNCGALSGTPYVAPFRIGAGGYGVATQVPWPGYVDEVAFYTNALSGLQASNHWAIGTNAARQVSYPATITSDGPIGYWRLNETNSAIAYNQSGTSLGSAANGIYEGSPVIPSSVDPSTGIPINPSNYPGTIASAAPGALSASGDNSAAINFMPPTVGGSTGAKVEVPFNPNLNTPKFSIEYWANLQSLGTWNSPMSSRYNVTGVWAGYDLLIDASGKLQFWLGSGQNLLNKLISANVVFSPNTWNHVVAVYDGAYMYEYVNGELVGVMQASAGFMPNPATTLRIGGGGSDTVGGNFYVNGSVDEAAYYGYPLTPAQVANHYATGRGTPTPAATAPTFSVVPQSVTIDYGGSASMTGIAVGSVPMQYQWYKDGSKLLNQTNSTLNLSNLIDTATGTYEIWATNGAGSSSASAFLQVNGAASPTLVTDLPAITRFYPGASPQLSVSVSGSLPFTYFWSSNGVRVAVTTVPALTLTNLSAAASGAHYSLLISNAFGTLPSAGTTLQALTPVTGDYVARALALNPLAYWRLGDDASSNVAMDCWGGNHGQYVGVNQHILPGALALNDDGCAQVPGGAFIQVPGAAFDNFSTASQFTLMAWVKPDSITGVQRVFSTRQTASGASYGFGFGLNTKNLIFSGFGVADVSFTATIAAGQWYHLAAVYSNKTVTCYVNGSVVGTANTALNALMPSTAPLYIGGNPTGSEWFSGFIDEAAIYGSALSGAQILNIFGTKPSITLAPVPVTALAGSVAKFSILGSGQTPLSYQWRTNGVAMLTQTNTSLVFVRVPLALNGLQVTCVITNALGSITSAPVALTVNTGSGYVGSVLADQPVAYWRLNESSGPTVFDYVATHDGTAVGSGLTYRDPNVVPALAVGGDSDPCVGFNGSGAFVVPYSPELNQRVFSVECWVNDSGAATGFAAPVSSRVNSPGSGFNFYAGMEPNFLGYTWQMWTANGTASSWNYAVGPVIENGNWAHLVSTYDGSNVTFYVNGAPLVTNATPYATNSISPFSIGAVASGQPYSLAAYFSGDVDEVAYYGYVLSPYQAMGHYLLATYGDNQAPQVAPDLAPQQAFVGLPCALSAGVAGSVPMSYQWFKNNVPVRGGSGTSYCATNCFALNFAHVQASDAGTYKLVVTNAAGSANSSEATLTIIPRPAIGSAGFVAGGGGFKMQFSGPVGMGYRIWTSPDPSLSPVESTWSLVTSGTFTGGTDEFIDTSAQPTVPTQFYLLTVP